MDAGVQLKKTNCINNTASILILDANQLEFYSEFHSVGVATFVFVAFDEID